MNLAPVRQQLLTAGCWGVVLGLASVPVNKPATNIFMALALLGSVLGERTGERWRAALAHPVVRGALLWWAVLGLSALYTPSLLQGLRHWLGHIVLMYPLIVVSLFGHDDRWRWRAAWGFSLVMLLIVLTSWGQLAGWVDFAFGKGATDHRTVFKEYTQQGVQTLVWSSWLLAVAVAPAGQRARKALLLAGAALGIASVVKVLPSRTALLSLLALLMFWGLTLKTATGFGRRATGVTLALAMAGAGALMYVSTLQQARWVEAYDQFQQSLTTRAPTSTGVRIELYRQSLRIIEQAPLIGHGLGQWHAQFSALTQNEPDYDAFRLGTPHQEFLGILAEQGLIGLLIYAGLLIGLALLLRRLAPPWRWFYGSLLLVYLTAAMINSLWTDFTHRHLFTIWLACMPWAAARARDNPPPAPSSPLARAK